MPRISFFFFQLSCVTDNFLTFAVAKTDANVEKRMLDLSVWGARLAGVHRRPVLCVLTKTGFFCPETTETPASSFVKYTFVSRLIFG